MIGFLRFETDLILTSQSLLHAERGDDLSCPYPGCFRFAFQSKDVQGEYIVDCRICEEHTCLLVFFLEMFAKLPGVHRVFCLSRYRFHELIRIPCQTWLQSITSKSLFYWSYLISDLSMFSLTNGTALYICCQGA